MLAVLAEGLYRAVAKRKLFYSVGTTELLEQPEFQDIKRVQPILSLLEQQDQLSTLLGKKEHPEGRGINITIGSENEAEPLKNLSVIQADFTDKKDRIGTLAILGPTRMEYARIIGILSYMQEFIEALAKSKK